MYILFDIGGTKMRIACSVRGHILNTTETVNTPSSYAEGVKLFADVARRVSKKSAVLGDTHVTAVVGGIAGPLDHEKTKLIGGANLSHWVGQPFADDVSRALHAPVFLQNDAALVALGEATHGAGRHFSIVMYMTVSTGVGGARIVNKKIDEASVGFEPGNQIVDVDHTLMPGVAGVTLQDYISGAALAERTGKKPRDIHDQVMWDDVARVLAIGLNNTIVHWSPDVVVLGGSMITGHPGISVEATARYLSEFLKVYPVLPAIKKAELADEGGLYGALEYAQTKKVLG